MYLFQGIWVELLSKLVAYDSLDGAEQAFERILLGAKQGQPPRSIVRSYI
jgi:hypothetical protein